MKMVSGSLVILIVCGKSFKDIASCALSTSSVFYHPRIGDFKDRYLILD